MNKRFLRFRYAAIKRYGAKYWAAGDGYIEFNPNYVVSCSQDEKPLLSNGHDNPFILELSNGTKCLVWMHEYGAANGVKRPMFVMNRDGFSLLAMGLTGVKAMQNTFTATTLQCFTY